MKPATDSPKVTKERLTTRIGKIARLPKEVREQLNHRLQDGEQGQRLLGWLNSLPEVTAVLQSDFGGEPITKQNLTKWRQGGYRDWQLQQAAVEAIHRLVGDAEELRQTSTVPLTDMLALWLVARYVVAANKLKTDDWRRLRELCADLVELRKGDHSGERIRLERERLEMEQDQLNKLRDEELRKWGNEHRDEICRGYQSPEEVLPRLVNRMFGEKPAAGDRVLLKQPACEGCIAPDGLAESKPVAPSQTSNVEQHPVRA